MNTATAEVTVYNFRILDSGFESAPVSTFKATRQAILDVFGGDPIDGTEERVSPDELDASGSYRRLATAWGELS